MQGSGNLLHMSAFFEVAEIPGKVTLGAICGRVRFAREWSSGAAWWRTLQDCDLWFVREGRGCMEMETGPLVLSAGTCVWMRRGRRYAMSHDPDHRLGVYFFHFTIRARNRGRLLEAIPEVFYPRREAALDSALAWILKIREEPGGAESASRLFAALLAELVREAANRPPDLGNARVRHAARMREIMTTISEHPEKDFQVATLARQHGYSTSHFSRVFSAVSGLRPQAFVIEARLARARELLASGSASVTAVAEAAGFKEIYYFSRLFHQRTGVSPSEYRRRVSGG
jgi:AraC family transcriptional regulator of arabinose operon